MFIKDNTRMASNNGFDNDIYPLSAKPLYYSSGISGSNCKGGQEWHPDHKC